MPIYYSLQENRLTPDPNDYMAMVSPSRSVELDGVIERMVERGSTVTRADILSVLEDFQRALESLLAEGANVNLPFANFSSSIRSVFDSATDNFDANRHQLSAAVTPGQQLREAYRRNITAVKQETITPAPNLLEYLDFNSGERNSIVTPGGMGQICGHRLKFDASDAQQGIFFLGEKEQQTRISVVGENKPARLMFLVPTDIQPGDYQVEVRALVGSEIRSGRFNRSLSVS